MKAIIQKHFKCILIYLYLYVAFLFILGHFTYKICKSRFFQNNEHFVDTLLVTVVLYVSYWLINKFLITRFIQIKFVSLFGKLLLIAIITVFVACFLSYRTQYKSPAIGILELLYW